MENVALVIKIIRNDEGFELQFKSSCSPTEMIEYQAAITQAICGAVLTAVRGETEH